MLASNSEGSSKSRLDKRFSRLFLLQIFFKAVGAHVETGKRTQRYVGGLLDGYRACMRNDCCHATGVRRRDRDDLESLEYYHARLLWSDCNNQYDSSRDDGSGRVNCAFGFS